METLQNQAMDIQKQKCIHGGDGMVYKCQMTHAVQHVKHTKMLFDVKCLHVLRKRLICMTRW